MGMMMSMMMMPGERRKGTTTDNDRRGGGMSIPLTFDCLLNCLDGVERSDGIFTIISTNDVSKVDPALGQPRMLPDGDLGVHQHAARAHRQGGRSWATWSRPTRRRWRAVFWGRTSRSTSKCCSSSSATRTCKRPRRSSRSGALRWRLKCFWQEQADAKAEAAQEQADAAAHQREMSLNGQPRGS